MKQEFYREHCTNICSPQTSICWIGKYKDVLTVIEIREMRNGCMKSRGPWQQSIWLNKECQGLTWLLSDICTFQPFILEWRYFHAWFKLTKYYHNITCDQLFVLSVTQGKGRFEKEDKNKSARKFKYKCNKRKRKHSETSSHLHTWTIANGPQLRDLPQPEAWYEWHFCNTHLHLRP